MKCLFLFLTFLTSLFGWSQPVLSQEHREIDFSLLADSGTLRTVIIGVGAFQSSDIPQLPNAAADANRFADSLQRSGGIDATRLKLLTDQEATAGQIAFTLDWLLESSRPGDRALIYLSGYWATETLRKQEYFIAYDAPPRVFMAGGTIAAPMLNEFMLALQQAQVQVWLVNHTTTRTGPFKE